MLSRKSSEVENDEEAAYELFNSDLYARNKTLLKKISTVNSKVVSILEELVSTGQSNLLQTSLKNANSIIYDHNSFENRNKHQSNNSNALLTHNPKSGQHTQYHNHLAVNEDGYLYNNNNSRNPNPFLQDGILMAANCTSPGYQQLDYVETIDDFENESAISNNTPHWGNSPSINNTTITTNKYDELNKYDNGTANKIIDNNKANTINNNDINRSLNGNNGNRKLIKACNVLKQFTPLIDTLEVEPLMMLHEIQSGNQTPKPELVAIIKFLYARAAFKVKEIYQRHSIRSICILDKGSVGFHYKSSKTRGQCKFVVPLTGLEIKIESINGEDVERYALDGTQDIPENHLIRYTFLRDALRLIRAVVPRVFVADCRNLVAITLGSFRWPGLYIDIFRVSADQISDNIIVDNEEDSDDQLSFFASFQNETKNQRNLSLREIQTAFSDIVYDVHSVRLIREELPEDSNSDTDPRSNNIVNNFFQPDHKNHYYISNLGETPAFLNENSMSRLYGGDPNLFLSGYSSFAATTPSPLYSGANALWKQWHHQSSSANQNSVDESTSSFFQEQFENQRHLTTPDVKSLSHHRNLYSRKNNNTSSSSLQRVRRWFYSNELIEPEHMKIELEIAIKESRYVLVWLLSDFLRSMKTPIEVQTFGGLASPENVFNEDIFYDCTLEIFDENLHVLSEVHNKNVEGVEMYHSLIAEKKDTPVTLEDAHHIYESLFPVTSLIHTADLDYINNKYNHHRSKESREPSLYSLKNSHSNYHKHNISKNKFDNDGYYYRNKITNYLNDNESMTTMSINKLIDEEYSHHRVVNYNEKKESYFDEEDHLTEQEYISDDNKLVIPQKYLDEGRDMFEDTTKTSEENEFD